MSRDWYLSDVEKRGLMESRERYTAPWGRADDA